MTSRDQPRAQAGDPQSTPRLSGDELFVPASHVLVIDRQVSHPAFRLWCVLHRLWFLHEPPVMELLQELMGTTITDKATQAETWQPATRRSIERRLTELEQAGWLVWARRGETTRRYHLRTSARSATDTAVLTELRTLLNSGKVTLAGVRAQSTSGIPNRCGRSSIGASLPAFPAPVNSPRSGVAVNGYQTTY